MSERSIIICVVIALLAVAFFFPYESSDDEYYRSHGKKQTVQKVSDADALHHNDGKGMGDSHVITDDLPTETKAVSIIEGAETGSRAAVEKETIIADSAPLVAQINVAKQEVSRNQGGFAQGTHVEGKYVQIDPESATRPTLPPAASAPYISFHLDGSFEEHAALSFTSSSSGVSQSVTDVAGHYYLKGYVLTLDQITPGFKPEEHFMFSICSLGGQNDRGVPKRIYLEGNVFRLQAE
jgi:hypothetical protein